MNEQGNQFSFDGFAVFEAMGHIKRIGKVRTSDLGGNAVFVVETSDPEGQTVTEIFAASALFRLTPITEAVAAQTARGVNPSPVNPYDLPSRVQRALRLIEQEDRDKARAIEAPAGEDDGDDDGFDTDFEDVPL